MLKFKRFSRLIIFTWMFFVIFLLTASVLVAQPNQLRSPDGRYEAVLVGSGKDLHYRVGEIATGRIALITRAQYRTPNDVKAGMFSPDSREFAAAYHYGHEGNYTWIGIWDLQTGTLLHTVTKPGWIRDITWVFARRPLSEPPYTPYPSPTTGVSRPSKICNGEGNPCKVHPVECGGRGENWVVNGTIKCAAQGKPQCVAVAGKDYCNHCGGSCGGCWGESCSQSSLCSPGQECINYRPSINADQRWQCMTIGRGCTTVNNLCWTKDEVGKAQLGCVEGLR